MVTLLAILQGIYYVLDAHMTTRVYLNTVHVLKDGAHVKNVGGYALKIIYYLEFVFIPVFLTVFFCR